MPKWGGGIRDMSMMNRNLSFQLVGFMHVHHWHWSVWQYLRNVNVWWMWTVLSRYRHVSEGKYIDDNWPKEENSLWNRCPAEMFYGLFTSSNTIEPWMGWYHRAFELGLPIEIVQPSQIILLACMWTQPSWSGDAMVTAISEAFSWLEEGILGAKMWVFGAPKSGWDLRFLQLCLSQLRNFWWNPQLQIHRHTPLSATPLYDVWRTPPRLLGMVAVIEPQGAAKEMGPRTLGRPGCRWFVVYRLRFLQTESSQNWFRETIPDSLAGHERNPWLPAKVPLKQSSKIWTSIGGLLFAGSHFSPLVAVNMWSSGQVLAWCGRSTWSFSGDRYMRYSGPKIWSGHRSIAKHLSISFYICICLHIYLYCTYNTHT